MLTDHSSFYANCSAVNLLHASFILVMHSKSTAHLPGLKAWGKRCHSCVIHHWKAGRGFLTSLIHKRTITLKNAAFKSIKRDIKPWNDEPWWTLSFCTWYYIILYFIFYIHFNKCRNEYNKILIINLFWLFMWNFAICLYLYYSLSACYYYYYIILYYI